MSDVVISPNMSLPVPVVGTDSGPDWANNLNACLSILDQHNHSSGSGVQIQPAGLNINSNLTFQNNQATNLKGVVFSSQSSSTTLQAVYVLGVDLYYRDGSNNQIQITSGGAVNATSSGISSGTASASFVSSVLTVLAAATTPANIKGGSILLGNNTAGSKYLTLAPPNAMAADYGLVLPSIPASTSFMQIDTSGNMTAGPAISGGLTTSNLSASAGILGSQLSASAGIVGSQIASGTIGLSNMGANSVGTNQIVDLAVTNAKLANTNINFSSNSGNFNTTTGGLVTNQSITLTGIGRPVIITFTSDPSATTGSPSEIYSDDNSGQVYFTVAGGGVAAWQLDSNIVGRTFSTMTIPASGLNTYTVATNNHVTCKNMFLVVYEL